MALIGKRLSKKVIEERGKKDKSKTRATKKTAYKECELFELDCRQHFETFLKEKQFIRATEPQSLLSGEWHKAVGQSIVALYIPNEPNFSSLESSINHLFLQAFLRFNSKVSVKDCECFGDKNDVYMEIKPAPGNNGHSPN